MESPESICLVQTIERLNQGTIGYNVGLNKEDLCG